jgi:hypothetical protein
MTQTHLTSRAGWSVRSSGSRAAWLGPAAALVGAGWASQQFTPMLLVYGEQTGLGTGTRTALFGAYAIGLVPALLLAGQLADARGRRPVVLAAAGVSTLASLALMAGAHVVALLFVGRMLTGIGTGAAFAAGTVWLRELLASQGDESLAARRTVLAMTAGFALGPLAAGLLGQWGPAPLVSPYVPHVAIMAAVLLVLAAVPETATATGRVDLTLPRVRSVRFQRVVAPTAPWVFTAPAVAFGLLPSVVFAGRVTGGIVLTAAITCLCSLAGVAAQPLAARLASPARSAGPTPTGLVVLAAALALAAVTTTARAAWMLIPCAILFGTAYGLCLVGGLSEVQRIADDRTQAALTARYYTLAYVGFAVPYALSLAGHVTSYAIVLAATAALALATAALVTHRAARTPSDRARTDP